MSSREGIVLGRIANGGARTLAAYQKQGGYAALAKALAGPPEQVLAAVETSGLRGRCIQKFSASVVSAQWDHITLQGSHGALKISLLDVFTQERLRACAKIVDAAKCPDDLQSIAEPTDDPIL